MKRLPLMLPVLVAGCYTYAPVERTAVLPGMGLRARVSSATAERIAPLLGTSDARVLTGTLVENNSGTLLIEVPTAAQAGIAGSTQSLFQRISIAPGEVVDLESRRLDKKRTGLVVGLVAAAAISGAISALKTDPGTDNASPGSSAPENRVFMWRFRF